MSTARMESRAAGIVPTPTTDRRGVEPSRTSVGRGKVAAHRDLCDGLGKRRDPVGAELLLTRPKKQPGRDACKNGPGAAQARRAPGEGLHELQHRLAEKKIEAVARPIGA